jgi:hypothetical protein
MYDLGGLTMWYLFLLDYTSLKPEQRADAEQVRKLKAQYGCDIKAIRRG